MKLLERNFQKTQDFAHFHFVRFHCQNLNSSGLALHAETRNDISSEQLCQKTNIMGPFYAQLHSIPLWLFGQKVDLTHIFWRFTAQKKPDFLLKNSSNQILHQSRQMLIATTKKHAGDAMKTLTKCHKKCLIFHFTS